MRLAPDATYDKKHKRPFPPSPYWFQGRRQKGCAPSARSSQRDCSTQPSSRANRIWIGIWSSWRSDIFEDLNAMVVAIGNVNFVIARNGDASRHTEFTRSVAAFSEAEQQPSG